MKLCVLFIAFGLFLLSVKYYLSSNEPQVEVISQLKELSYKNNQPFQLINPKKAFSNNSFNSTSEISTKKQNRDIEEVKSDADTQVASSLLPPESRSISEDHLLLANPDVFATGIIQSNDDTVINIGEYIDVPTDEIENIGGDSGQSQLSEPEDVVNIGELMPLPVNEITIIGNNSDQYQLSEPEDVVNIGEFSSVSTDEIAIIGNNSEQYQFTELEDVVNIGEDIEVEIGLPD